MPELPPRAARCRPAALALLRRILGGDLAGVLAEPPLPGRRRGGRAGHRGHGGPPRPPPPLGAQRPARARPAGDSTAAFGVYVHVPFCRAALRLLRLRHLHRPRPPDGALRGRLRRRGRAGLGATRACPRPPPSSSAAARRPASTPTLLCRILDAIPAARRRRGHRRVQSRGRRRRRTSATYRGAGVTRVSFGVQSTHAARARRPRPAPRARRRPRPIAAAVAEAGFATWNLDLIFGGAGRDATTTGRAPSTTSSALDHPPPHVSAYGLTVEPGTPLAADPARHPDEDAQARPLRARRRGPHRGRLPLGGDLQLGPARPRVPAQPPLLGPGRLPSASVRPPTRTAPGARWWNVRTPDRYIAAIEAGPLARGRPRRTLDRRATASSRRSSLSLRTPRGVPVGTASTTRRPRRPGRAASTAGPCSPCGAGCWPTRSAPESGSGSPAPDDTGTTRPSRPKAADGRRPDGEGRAACASAAASSSRRPRSTAASAPPTTTARSASTCCATSRTPGGASMVQLRDDVVGLDAAILVARRPSGRPRATWPTSPTRWSTAATARSAGGPTRSTGVCPNCGSHRPHRGPGVQPDVQDPRRPGRGRGRTSPTCAPRRPRACSSTSPTCCRPRARSRRSASPRSASRSATRSRRRTSSSAPASSSRWRWSTSCRPTEADAVVRVLVRRALPLVPRPRHPRRQAAPAPPRRRRAVPLLGGHRRRGVPLPLGLGRARGHRQPDRLRPARPTPRRRARSSSTSTRRPTSATCPT